MNQKMKEDKKGKLKGGRLALFITACTAIEIIILAALVFFTPILVETVYWSFMPLIVGVFCGIIIFPVSAIYYGKSYWKYQYGEGGKNIFEVRNKATLAELYVNGELQDSSKRLFGSKLNGKLESGEKIKVSFKGSVFTIKCSVFVDDKLLDPLEVLDPIRH